jgi:hypothetical protein
MVVGFNFDGDKKKDINSYKNKLSSWKTEDQLMEKYFNYVKLTDGIISYMSGRVEGSDLDAFYISFKSLKHKYGFNVAKPTFLQQIIYLGVCPTISVPAKF